MNLWLISAFEPTPIDHLRPMRFMGIADAALQRGHKVTFFSGTFKHNTKTQRFGQTTYQSINENYKLVFVHSKPYHENISLKRMLAHYDLAKKLMSEIKKQNKPDVIFISLPPLSTVAKIVEWATKNNIPVVVDIIDPWPEVFVKGFPSSFQKIGKKFLWPFYQRFRNIIKKATAITAISEEYIQWSKKFELNGKPTSFFYPAVQFNEVKQAFNRLQSFYKKGDRLRIIYAGSLSVSYDIPTILSAAEIIEQKYPSQTEFIIAGAGPQESVIKEKDRKNVKFLGWLGQEDMYREFFLSDLGLTQHVKGATQSVTYKLFDYLSAGLPVLNSLKSEMGDIIVNNKVGFNNESGNAMSLVVNIERFINDKSLLQQYKQNALKLTAEMGDSKVVYNKLVQFIESVN